MQEKFSSVEVLKQILKLGNQAILLNVQQLEAHLWTDFGRRNPRRF